MITFFFKNKHVNVKKTEASERRKREPKKLSKLLKQNHSRAAAMESSQGHGDGEAKRETLAG